MITAIAVGSATITATTTDGSNKTDTINITVVVPDADVSIKNFKLNDGTSDYILIPAGDNFIFPNAPRSLSLPATTLTATLELGSTNATISPDPRTTPLSYANKTQFTVTSGDETVTKTYYVNVGADAYDATTNPYGIYTPAHLSDVRNALGASYKLMNDIALPNMTGYDNTADPAGMKITDYATNGWLPIGTDLNTTFSGTFDGNAHILSNLSINKRNGFLGLFGAIGGVVKNIGVATSNNGIVTPNSSTGYYQLGVLVGANNGNISNCYATGVIIKNTDGNGFGGIAGGGTGAITNCYATCSMTIAGKNSIIGGLCGYPNNGGNFSNCYVAGRIVNTGTGNTVGGIAGWNSISTISNCYWDTEVTTINVGAGSGDATGTTGKTTADMKTQAMVDLLNGTQTPKPWKYVSGSYPKLSWEQ